MSRCDTQRRDPGTRRTRSSARRTVTASLFMMVLIVLVLCIASCSDDIVCPDDTIIVAPSITAAVVESRLVAGDHTTVDVRCVTDPLTDDFAVFVTGRQIEDVQLDSPLALVASLEETDIIWQHGQECSLRVITDSGVATAIEVVPGAFAVEPPGDLSLGDTLRFRWSGSDNADYYTVRCVIMGARGDSLVLERSVTDTTAAFAPDEIDMAGSAAGWVRATTGPFTDGGTAGNVTGEGWGFFTVSYYDSLCLFNFEVTGLGRPHYLSASLGSR